MTARKSSYRSLASLERDLARCRACVEAGYPLESLPVRAPGTPAARVPVRPGAGRRRRRGAAAVARARRPDAPPLARARGGRVLRNLLLRLGHALLSRPRGIGPRRPDADAARAGALLLLARLGARAAAPAPDRHGRRAGAAAAARAPVAHAVRRRALRAGGNARRPAPPPLRRERLAQRPREPRAAGQRRPRSSARSSRRL